MFLNSVPSGSGLRATYISFGHFFGFFLPILPRHALIGYVGPSQDETCHPMMVAQYALAPAWLTELEDPRLRAVTRAEGSLVLPETPSLVLAWGEEGAAWLAAHPDYQPIAPPTEHAQLAARRAR